MNNYKIIKKDGEIRWDSVEAAEVKNQPWFTVDGIKMSFKLCYDREHIYVYQFCSEKNIRAEISSPNGDVCQDSCMEFFFAPVSGDGRYINFEVNPNGSVCLGIGFGRADRLRICPKDPISLFNIQTGRTDDGWFVKYAVGADFIRTLFCGFEGFTSGMEMGANVFKCGDLTEREHYLTWNAMTSAAPDYHRSCDFGKMYFE